MNKPRYAIILYTVREPAKVDLVDTLKQVRDIGFEYVQWSGMPDLPADKIRAALDTAGLKAIAGHCPIEPFERDFEATLRHWKTIGVTDLAPGGMMGDCKATLADWRRGARRLDAVGAKLREAGIRLSYHNHAFEFERFDEDPRRKLDILYEETEPANLCAELDLGWVHAGGADPAAYLRKFAARCPVVHAKDLKMLGGAVEFAALGCGALDWDAVLDAGVQSGVEWFIYEQDTCQGNLWGNVRISYEFLRQRLG